MYLGDAATLTREPSSDPGRVDSQRRSGAAFFADAVSPRNPTHRLLSGVAQGSPRGRVTLHSATPTC
jgi:hypothetical protein